MARTKEDIEAYLLRLNRRFEHDGDGTYLVSGGPNQPVTIVRVDPPVVLVQVDIGEAPKGDPALEAKFFRKLLEFNSSDLVHVAYALEGNDVVLAAALEIENLDLNELEAALSGIDMALAQHIPLLRELSPKS